MNPPRYVLISPCRDEAEYLLRTVDSVAQQTLPPALWVVVDDGSTDQTPNLLKEVARQHPFIRVVTRKNRGRRAVGPGVVDAFYAGYETIDAKDFDHLCKLDLDLVLPTRYFETLVRRMETNPRLGTCSGKPYYHSTGGTLVSEGCGDETSVGMTKFYRRECFEEVGGFVREVMWDGIDCHRCRMLGWIACSWDEPELRFVHLRPMGASDRGVLRGRLRHGYGQYFMGTSPAYMAVAALNRMRYRPYVWGGLAMLAGYAGSVARRDARYPDSDFRAFLRAFQRECLLKGKRRATLELDRRQAEVFEARHGPTK